MGPSLAASPSKPRAVTPRTAQHIFVRIYEAMKRQRMLDERMVILQRQGRIGFYGSTTGQEAATIGSVAALEKRDWVVPALREAGAALYRGLPLEQYVAQLYGNSADWIKGRQMPCHFTFAEGHYVSMSSCIGTQLPHAVGIAMAARYKKDPAVVLAYLGEGATSEGDFHAAMNFAGVYKAPVVFFCQNNHWAISVPASKQTAAKSFASKAQAYGFEGIKIDGNDAVKVYNATLQAVAKARRGQGPVLIEAVTYRMGGHTTSDDPSRYRDEKETARWKKLDPIARLKKYLEQRRMWNAKLDQKLEEVFATELKEIVNRIEKAPPSSVESMFEDVYGEMPWHLRAQMNEAQGRNVS